MIAPATAIPHQAEEASEEAAFAAAWPPERVARYLRSRAAGAALCGTNVELSPGFIRYIAGQLGPEKASSE